MPGKADGLSPLTRQSAALSEERRPGFGRMDADERHSRAGRASVPVREADERSDGTAKRREDRRVSGDSP
ncbi:hypothetical protein CQW29_09560 [Pantoea coffeiphila]|uniref:Uncharacterized protein n=1 Tax=Pantoea coffeiphila TaxID=1465635 RepID=A0A2S9IDC7_9GAMM|nr:hypothetical protein CQW29_09560 [Pantoea coffeiphila]